MANHKISEIEKSIVLERLAQGLSLKQAIAGTSIKSKSTAAMIARGQSNEIEQIREEYSELIQLYTFNTRIERARMWSQALNATKKIPSRDSEYADLPTSRDGYINVPDWPVRLTAMKYLDQLDGITAHKSVNLTVMQQFNKNN